MSEGLALAGGYAEHEPESAARALEDLPAPDAALFLDRLTPALAAQLLTHMAPAAAARCLALLDEEQARATLGDLEARPCATILRAGTAEARRRWLAQLPPRRAQQFQRSLHYAPDAVGAWIEYDAPSISVQRSVGEALSLLRQRAQAGDAVLFLVGRGHRYAGLIAIPALLHQPAETPLAKLADARVRPLSDLTEVDEIADLADWELCPLLPVTTPDGTLLGGLSRTALRRALESVFPSAPSSDSESLTAHLLRAYLHVISELLRLAFGPGRRAP